MKDTLKRALAAKQTQRAKARHKSYAEKLAIVEQMRDLDAALARGRGSVVLAKKRPRSVRTP